MMTNLQLTLLAFNMLFVGFILGWIHFDKPITKLIGWTIDREEGK